MEKDIFYKNLLNFLNENKNDYFQILLKENNQYKILNDSLYNCLEIISKKLPTNDCSVDNLIYVLNELSNFENSFLYLQGFRDCCKINNFMNK